MLKCITLDEDQCIHSMFLCETLICGTTFSYTKFHLTGEFLFFIFFLNVNFFYTTKKKKKNHVQESLMKLVAIMFAYSKMKYSIIYLVFIFYF